MKRIFVSTLVGLAALTAGCTGTVGSPTPGPTTGASTPTSDSNASSGLASIKPCDLLTDSEAASFNLKLPGESSKIVDAEVCDWIISGDGGLQVGLRANTAVKDLSIRGEKVSDVKAGKFSATKVEAQDGAKASCMILIESSETSSVAIIASKLSSSTDTAAACERATKAADLIAPKLP